MTTSIFTQAELESKKLTEITDHYNQVAKLIGLKSVKKFRDKPTAISCTLDAQETYQGDLIEAAKAVVKEKKQAPKSEPESEYPTLEKEFGKNLDNLPIKKNKLNIDYTTIIEAKSGITPKEGSIEATLFDALALGSENIENIIRYVLSNHKRPRSDQKVDEQYALHNIKWFVKKGHLKVVG